MISSPAPARITTDALEPNVINIVTTVNFRVDRCWDPDGTVGAWFEVTLADDHTLAAHREALSYLPPTARIQDWDSDLDERTYFYTSGVVTGATG